MRKSRLIEPLTRRFERRGLRGLWRVGWRREGRRRLAGFVGLSGSTTLREVRTTAAIGGRLKGSGTFAGGLYGVWIGLRAVIVLRESRCPFNRSNSDVLTEKIKNQEFVHANFG